MLEEKPRITVPKTKATPRVISLFPESGLDTESAHGAAEY
jgi:hypothetical protein